MRDKSFVKPVSVLGVAAIDCKAWVNQIAKRRTSANEESMGTVRDKCLLRLIMSGRRGQVSTDRYSSDRAGTPLKTPADVK